MTIQQLENWLKEKPANIDGGREVDIRFFDGGGIGESRFEVFPFEDGHYAGEGYGSTIEEAINNVSNE